MSTIKGKVQSPYTQSFLYLHKAEALSREGDHRRAGTALNRAASLWERHTVEENPDWLDWFGEAQLKSTEGKVLLRSGQVERATSSLETSVEKAAPGTRPYGPADWPRPGSPVATWMGRSTPPITASSSSKTRSAPFGLWTG